MPWNNSTRARPDQPPSTLRRSRSSAALGTASTTRVSLRATVQVVDAAPTRAGHHSSTSSSGPSSALAVTSRRSVDPPAPFHRPRWMPASPDHPSSSAGHEGRNTRGGSNGRGYSRDTEFSSSRRAREQQATVTTTTSLRATMRESVSGVDRANGNRRQRSSSTTAVGRPQRGPVSQDDRILHHMNSTLQRLCRTIEQRVEECQRQGQDAGELVQRAERLRARMEVLKGKLRVCFQMSGTQEPGNLQVVLQQLDAVDNDDDAPAEFLCPISQCVMVDPVKTTDDQTYDRASIIEWFASCGDGRALTSPLTNLPLDDPSLTPNLELREKIQAYIAAKQNVGSVGGSAPAAHSRATAANRSVDGFGGAGSPGGCDNEEPSLRHVPANVRVGSQALTSSDYNDFLADEAARGLHHLDDGGVDGMSPPTAARDREAEAHAMEDLRPRSSGPIWSSAVVPASEQHSRALNLLRTNRTIALPEQQEYTQLLGGGERGERGLGSHVSPAGFGYGRSATNATATPGNDATEAPVFDPGTQSLPVGFSMAGAGRAPGNPNLPPRRPDVQHHRPSETLPATEQPSNEAGGVRNRSAFTASPPVSSSVASGGRRLGTSSESPAAGQPGEQGGTSEADPYRAASNTTPAAIGTAIHAIRRRLNTHGNSGLDDGLSGGEHAVSAHHAAPGTTTSAEAPSPEVTHARRLDDLTSSVQNISAALPSGEPGAANPASGVSPMRGSLRAVSAISRDSPAPPNHGAVPSQLSTHGADSSSVARSLANATATLQASRAELAAAPVDANDPAVVEVLAASAAVAQSTTALERAGLTPPRPPRTRTVLEMIEPPSPPPVLSHATPNAAAAGLSDGSGVDARAGNGPMPGASRSAEGNRGFASVRSGSGIAAVRPPASRRVMGAGDPYAFDSHSVGRPRTDFSHGHVPRARQEAQAIRHRGDADPPIPLSDDAPPPGVVGSRVQPSRAGAASARGRGRGGVNLNTRRSTSNPPRR